MGIIINAEDVRKEADKIIEKSHGYAVPKEVEKTEITAIDIPFTHDGWRMLELVYEEARKLEHNYIGSGHLLLAFMSDERCLAYLVLANLGANASNIRTEVIRMLGENNNETLVEMNYKPIVDKIDEELREIEKKLSQVEEEMIKALDDEDLEKAHNLYSQKSDLGREMFVLKAKRANLSMWS
ncbi:unnamed protein product [Eruca vesicaria subsp. sativa]|uniref:Clp R domain-containing protein n=1 Tax=Eruca vesicaria subsp. sativa TaxID=29727 RepID=A0ABC8KCH8_ERUVS|nr:unnamed protein product [Eruca vesicaria subsp. sativa]